MSRQRFRHAAPRRRFRPLVVAAVVLAVLVLAGLVVARTGKGSVGGGTGGYPGITVDSTAPPSAPAADQTAAEQTAVDITWPMDLSWITVAGLDLPVSATAGPAVLAGGRARGFGRTPAGAVLAALHLLVRSSPQVGPAVFEPTLREQVVGPDLVAYVDAVRLGYRTGRERLGLPDGAPLGRIYASIGGVRIDAYSPQAASLRLLIEAPGTDGGIARAATVVQVSWSGTDWRLIAPPGGDWARVRALVPAGLAAGYTPLPGR